MVLLSSNHVSFPSTEISQCSYDGDVRLANEMYMYFRNGSSYFEGRVEICRNGSYGAICDSGWDELDAQVVCQYYGSGYSKSLHKDGAISV